MNQNQLSSLFVFAVGLFSIMLIASIVIVYIKINAGEPINTNYNDPLIIVGIVAGIMVMPAGLFLYRTSISKAKQQTFPVDKIKGARTAVIIRCAIWEAGVVINLIAFFLYNSWVSLITAGVIILFFLAQLPAPSRIKNDLEIE